MGGSLSQKIGASKLKVMGGGGLRTLDEIQFFMRAPLSHPKVIGKSHRWARPKKTLLWSMYRIFNILFLGNQVYQLRQLFTYPCATTGPAHHFFSFHSAQYHSESMGPYVGTHVGAVNSCNTHNSQQTNKQTMQMVKNMKASILCPLTMFEDNNLHIWRSIPMSLDALVCKRKYGLSHFCRTKRYRPQKWTIFVSYERFDCSV